MPTSSAPFVAEPRIIQGGMGVGVSSWQLAGTVSSTGQLGVVSGTALDFVIARRLQDGDVGGHVRLALAAFPDADVARRVQERFFVEGGRELGTPYRGLPLPSLTPHSATVELQVVAGFVEVFLAKSLAAGHPVGINFLMKIPLPLVPTAYGAMLAGVDVVIGGAGSPKAIPGLLDRLSQHADVSIDVKVLYAKEGGLVPVAFSPRAAIAGGPRAPLARPRCLAIVASNDLAEDLAGASSPPDGFVIEGPSAGGHNAPPRGPPVRSDAGEPVYSEKDEVDTRRLAALGLPFWLAGGYGSPEGLALALEVGARGVQVGTAFALAHESGLAPALRTRLLEAVVAGDMEVFTDPAASPTGFPFKVAKLEGSVSDPSVYEDRPRACDVGLLRVPFESKDGKLGYRCPSEPAAAFQRKRGLPMAVEGRVCLCNGLLATIGLAQVRRNGYVEPPLVTAGDDLERVRRFLPPGASSYGARDVVETLLAA
jgi:NAD(P)H-dependent flavin oxidoreductase YrpB (nitropropane dioxygenase family)